MILVALAALTLIPMSMPGQTPATAARVPDLSAIQSQVDAYGSKLYAEAKASGQTVDRGALNAKVGAFAADLLKDVRVDAIPPKDVADWAQLYERAGDHEVAMKLEEKALAYHSTQLMFTDCDLIPSLLKSDKEAEVTYLLRHAPDYMPRQLGMVGDVFFGTCQRLGLDKSKSAFVEKGIRILEAKLDEAPHQTLAEKNSMVDNVYVGFEMDLLKLKYGANRDPKLIAALKALRRRVATSKSADAFGRPPTHEIDDFLAQVAVTDGPAPTLVFQKEIGDFPGIAALRGKVVLLDFMAHWCGPCKAALPSIRKLRDEFGSSLQIVSVSSFYGYYGTRTGISKPDEFGLMHGFVKEFGITWPVIFDEKQESQSRYGVSAIPYMVVVDKKGIIRSIQVGHTPEGEVAIEQLIRKLVAAGA